MVHSWEAAQGCGLGSLPSKAAEEPVTQGLIIPASKPSITLCCQPPFRAPLWLLRGEGRRLRMRDDTRVLLAPHSGGLRETLASGRTESHLCHSLLANSGSGTLPFKGLSFLISEMVVVLPASHYHGEDCYLLQGMLAEH